MIGERAYQNAMRRRAELRQELEDIETFLRLCSRFAGESFPSHASAAPDMDVSKDRPEPELAGEPEHLVEIGGKELRPRMREAILDVGRPLNRSGVVAALNRRGFRVSGQDQVVNVGTALWRARDEFVRLEGHGYWPRDVAYAPAGYDPDASGLHGGDAGEGDEDSAVSDDHAPAGNGTSSFAWGTP